jgi:hypothetical protein
MPEPVTIGEAIGDPELEGPTEGSGDGGCCALGVAPVRAEAASAVAATARPSVVTRIACLMVLCTA